MRAYSPSGEVEYRIQAARRRRSKGGSSLAQPDSGLGPQWLGEERGAGGAAARAARHAETLRDAHPSSSPLPPALARDCLWYGVWFGDCLRCSEDLVHTCTAVARAREDSVSVYGHAWPLACWMWSGVAAARARACVSAGL